MKIKYIIEVIIEEEKISHIPAMTQGHSIAVFIKQILDNEGLNSEVFCRGYNYSGPDEK